MSGTASKAGTIPGRRNSAFLKDLMAWNRATGEDNSEQLERLRRNLRRARETELTPRQKEMVHLYFDQGMSVTQIAQQEGIHKSSVSRTLNRAKARLKSHLQYSF